MVTRKFVAHSAFTKFTVRNTTAEERKVAAKSGLFELLGKALAEEGGTPLFDTLEQEESKYVGDNSADSYVLMIRSSIRIKVA